MTYRFEVIGIENRQQAEEFHPKGAFALASWHETCFGGVMGHAFQNLSLLISPSFDGDVAAHVAKKLGIKAVRGSSSRKGKAAREAYLSLAPQGTSIGITVDGPKGPRRKAKSGIVAIARDAKLAILPTTSFSRNPIILHKSWDKMKIPKLFSRVYIVYGKPIFVKPDMDTQEFDDALKKVEQSLSSLHESYCLTLGGQPLD